MSNMRLFFEIVAKATGLKTELAKSKNSVSSFARSAKREIDGLKASLNTVTGKIAALGVSFGVAQQMLLSARLDKSLTQIGQTAGESSDKVKGLREDLFTFAKQTGQGIEDLRDGFKSLVQSGLTMKEARETLEGINAAMAVTGANAQTLAGGLTVAATAFQFDLSRQGKALDLLDKMTVAGRLGNAELENLSQIFARVGVNASTAGMGFEKTLGFIEALSMVERQPERLATLADSTLRVFTNLKYMTEAQKGTGIKFFNADGSRRDALEVLKNIKSKYDTLKTDQQRALFIQKAFGHADLDTIKGIRTLLQGDALAKIEGFSDRIASAGGTLKKDLGEATRNLVDQAGRLKASLREAADSFAQPINNVLAKAINLKNAGGTAAGIAQGKAIEAATGVTPVFVTNWPLKFMEGESSPIDAFRSGPLTTGKIADAPVLAGTGLKKLLTTRGTEGLLGAGKGLSALRTGAMIAAAGLGTTGLLAETAARGGAAIGTGLNFVLNKIVEKITGEDKGLGGVIYDLFNKKSADKVLNEIKLTVNIDKEGRQQLIAEGNQKTALNRGTFAPAY